MKCSKDQTFDQAENQTNRKTIYVKPRTSNPPEGDISVTNYGFLRFGDWDVLDDYCDFVTHSTHIEVQEWLMQQFEFESLGSSLYGSMYSEDTVTNEQLRDYLLDQYSVVQVDSIIMKPIENNDFLLTITQSYFNEQTYEFLLGGDYNSNCMNKFATHVEEEAGGLIERIMETPIGIEETEPGTVAQRKFCGWQEGNCVLETCPQNQNCICNKCPERKFIFWIWTGQERETFKPMIENCPNE